MRPTPQAIDAEKGLLGSILLSPDRVISECVRRGASERTFCDPTHARIYSVVAEMRRGGRPVDLITLTQYLDDKGILDDVGGAGRITDLFSFVPTASNATYYLDLLFEKEAERETESIARKLLSGDISREEARDRLDNVSTSAARVPEGRPLIEFGFNKPDPNTVLLGSGFLRREGGFLMVGSSGIGKSVASIQQDALWSLGKSAFGITPARPLRIVTVQAEDDDEDVGEMVRGVAGGLKFTDEELRQIGERVTYVSEKSRTGDEFLQSVIRPLLATHRPDLIRINPFMAYLGADVVDTQATAAFLRSGLNPLLEEFQCGCVLVHHTPKVTNRDTSAWRASDWGYAGAGGADVTNWARAILVMDATANPSVFKFVAAKRGKRLGWADDSGNPTSIRYFAHHESGICWIESTEAAAESSASGAGKYTKRFEIADILTVMSALDGMTVTEIRKAVSDESGMSKATFFRLWESAKGQQKVEAKEGKWFRK